jgi:uncharacterized protein
VTVRLYPDDNHAFFPGDRPSTPAEYDVPQHVDPRVVADVGEWLAAVAAGGSANAGQS